MKVTMLLIITRLAAAIPSKSTEPFWYYSKVDETDSRPSLPEDSKTVLRRAGEQADLRIASKRAYYDNNKPYGESEVITLYIYNAGPNRAVAPEIRAGYGGSMDQDKATTTLRQVHEWRQPSQDIKHRSLAWTSLPNPSSRIDGWDMVTTLPDVQAGVLMELNIEFPMTHAASYADKTVKASVSSSTTDPRKENDEATYIITPNHHNDGQDYWNTPGNLANLDFNGLTAEPLSQADLRIASVRERYNNNLPYGENEVLTFLVFNDGPTIATRPVLMAGYTTSMDYDKMSSSAEQVWVPDGVDPSWDLEHHVWQPLDGVSCRIDGWNVVCDLPDIPPTVLYRVHITFPMSHETTYKDYTATAKISSQATDLNPDNDSTSYFITPNHSKDGDEYWRAPGNMAQLNGPSAPVGGRPCLTGWLLDTPIIMSNSNDRAQLPLSELEGWVSAKKGQVMSYDIGQKQLKPKTATDVEYGTSTEVTVVSFSSDGETQLSYSAHPDTLVYLDPTTIQVGQDKVRLGYWIPVRMLWVGATVRGMSPDGGITSSQVTNTWQAKGSEFRSAQPHMVSQSHSYVIGTMGAGGILTHNPNDNRLCGDANRPATLATLAFIARLLIATPPLPNVPNLPQAYHLRHRRPTDPPPARPAHGPPVLPADVPRRDEHGNWLIYLYEEDTPAAVENARYAVNEAGHPWQLTYDPAGAAPRRRQSTGSHPSQRELLQLTTTELTGGAGTGQLDRDEYPPAIAREGGTGAVVTYIEAGDNRRAGSLMGQQFTNYRMDPQPDGHAPFGPGDTFRYAIIHENMRSIEYLGDGMTDETQIDPPPTP
ncbi:nuclease [Metarhizium guizhouense ARSEF 977]|uniref:Nuclease n=1 Tax=Metarhizium guizhouense (strain ARSEF 977) TaxID=1276136 RepID=A0A0B4GVD9_METGA|nr:nuclease [Metarhizium guizhouense ARSEF 977]